MTMITITTMAITTTGTTMITTTPGSPTCSAACARWRRCWHEKGYLDAAAMDKIVETYETRVGPHIGAKVVAGVDRSAFKAALLADGSKAIKSLGIRRRDRRPSRRHDRYKRIT